MDFGYKFPVVHGMQAGKDYFIAMLPLKMLSRIFVIDCDYIRPEYRAQRRLNESRVPVIKKYILDNPSSYVFSALAASIDGETEYHPSGVQGLGVLEVSMDSTFLINDGQHRIAAINEAIEENEDLANETIPVVLFEDRGLTRSQQMFTDLNKHAVRTSNSISELYDSRDQVAVCTRRVVSEIPFLDRYTDKEKDNLGKYSSSLFTLNMFYNANKKIIGKAKLTGEATNFIGEFWRSVSSHMEPWHQLESGEIKKVELRESTISTQAVLIKALGRIGSYLMKEPGFDLSVMDGLEEIDWSRNSPDWQLRTVKADGRIIPGEKSSLLTCNAIKKHLNLPFTSEEAGAEEKFSDEHPEASI